MAAKSGEVLMRPTERTQVADRLRMIREGSGLSQVDFCARTGISPQAWNNYERGARLISLDQALAVCSATNVTLDFIYRGLTLGVPSEIVNAAASTRPGAGKKIHAA